jgi:hypothetical protein
MKLCRADGPEEFRLQRTRHAGDEDHAQATTQRNQAQGTPQSPVGCRFTHGSGSAQAEKEKPGVVEDPGRFTAWHQHSGISGQTQPRTMIFSPFLLFP